MDLELELVVNGKKRSTRTDGRRPLLDVLREDLGLTGAKYGCGEGQCRACTVLVDGRPTLSCLMPVSVAQNRQIRTIEGLAEGGELHAVQRAFLERGAVQCGYCTPGMILASVALLEASPRPTRRQIVTALNGNLCRCCGYEAILDAVEDAAEAMRKGDAR